MLEPIKYCSRCGAKISDINTADYYSHIRIKYCDVCRERVNQENTLLRVHALRKRRREKNKLLDTQLELLKEENELLHQRVKELRELCGRLGKERTAHAHRE